MGWAQQVPQTLPQHIWGLSLLPRFHSGRLELGLGVEGPSQRLFHTALSPSGEAVVGRGSA